MGQRRGDRVWDLGLQPERTSLAWTRSLLSLLATGAVLIRLLALERAGVALGAAAVLGTALAALLVLAARRYRRGIAQLSHRAPLPDGRLIGLTAATAAALGILGGAVLLAG